MVQPFAEPACGHKLRPHRTHGNGLLRSGVSLTNTLVQNRNSLIVCLMLCCNKAVTYKQIEDVSSIFLNCILYWKLFY